MTRGVKTSSREVGLKKWFVDLASRAKKILRGLQSLLCVWNLPCSQAAFPISSWSQDLNLEQLPSPYVYHWHRGSSTHCWWHPNKNVDNFIKWRFGIYRSPQYRRPSLFASLLELRQCKNDSMDWENFFVLNLPRVFSQQVAKRKSAANSK